MVQACFDVNASHNDEIAECGWMLARHADTVLPGRRYSRGSLGEPDGWKESNPMPGIDTLDEQVINALQENGRLTMKALAEQVGLSSPAMIERVRRLEERGVLSGYRAVVEPAAIGRSLTALIRAEVPSGAIDAFNRHLAAEPAVVEAHRTSGLVNFQLKAHVADGAALQDLLDDLGELGARCDADLVLSTPVAWRPLSAPAGTVRARTRLSRRAGGGTKTPRATAERPAGRRGPGRPRGSGRKAATS